MKKLIGIYTSPRGHWVGDGFPVRTLFSYDSMGKHISPFLLLTTPGRPISPRPSNVAASASILIAALKP
jgi:hypothetical protein